MCDKVEEEKSRVEEEATREVMRETHLGMSGKRKKIKKKEGGEKDDWTVVRGEESDKCVVVEERADGSRKLVTRDIPVKKQIWSWAVNSLSDRKVVECRDIGLFSISNSISCRTSHIECIR